MAKIKLGAIVVDMRGKSNGHVFSKNRGGAYMRTKVTPTNPQTSSQMGVRGIFASISSAWSSLTEANRASWNGLVSSYARTDVFGDLRNPTGKNLFQRLNQNLIITGQAQKTICPEPAEVPFASLNSVMCDVSDTTMEVFTAGDTTGCKVMIFATPVLSAGTTFVKNRLRLVTVLPGADPIEPDIWSVYVAKFGAPTAGANIYVGVRVINANGQASPLEVKKATINA